jgi:hypothetical protein
MGQLEVRSDYTLPALDHESVIIAAREMFKELQIEDPWWIADVYITGASKSATGVPECLIQQADPCPIFIQVMTWIFVANWCEACKRASQTTSALQTDEYTGIFAIIKVAPQISAMRLQKVIGGLF